MADFTVTGNQPATGVPGLTPQPAGPAATMPVQPATPPTGAVVAQPQQSQSDAWKITPDESSPAGYSINGTKISQSFGQQLQNVYSDLQAKNASPDEVKGSMNRFLQSYQNAVGNGQDVGKQVGLGQGLGEGLLGGFAQPLGELGLLGAEAGGGIVELGAKALGSISNALGVTSVGQKLNTFSNELDSKLHSLSDEGVSIYDKQGNPITTFKPLGSALVDPTLSTGQKLLRGGADLLSFGIQAALVAATGGAGAEGEAATGGFFKMLTNSIKSGIKIAPWAASIGGLNAVAEGKDMNTVFTQTAESALTGVLAGTAFGLGTNGMGWAATKVLTNPAVNATANRLVGLLSQLQGPAEELATNGEISRTAFDIARPVTAEAAKASDEFTSSVVGSLVGKDTPNADAIIRQAGDISQNAKRELYKNNQDEFSGTKNSGYFVTDTEGRMPELQRTLSIARNEAANIGGRDFVTEPPTPEEIKAMVQSGTFDPRNPAGANFFQGPLKRFNNILDNVETRIGDGSNIKVGDMMSYLGALKGQQVGVESLDSLVQGIRGAGFSDMGTLMEKQLPDKYAAFQQAKIDYERISDNVNSTMADIVTKAKTADGLVQDLAQGNTKVTSDQVDEFLNGFKTPAQKTVLQNFQQRLFQAIANRAMREADPSIIDKVLQNIGSRTGSEGVLTARQVGDLGVVRQVVGKSLDDLSLTPNKEGLVASPKVGAAQGGELKLSGTQAQQFVKAQTLGRIADNLTDVFKESQTATGFTKFSQSLLKVDDPDTINVVRQKILSGPNGDKVWQGVQQQVLNETFGKEPLFTKNADGTWDFSKAASALKKANIPVLQQILGPGQIQSLTDLGDIVQYMSKNTSGGNLARASQGIMAIYDLAMGWSRGIGYHVARLMMAGGDEVSTPAIIDYAEKNGLLDKGGFVGLSKQKLASWVRTTAVPWAQSLGPDIKAVATEGAVGKAEEDNQQQ